MSHKCLVVIKSKNLTFSNFTSHCIKTYTLKNEKYTCSLTSNVFWNFLENVAHIVYVEYVHVNLKKKQAQFTYLTYA